MKQIEYLGTTPSVVKSDATVFSEYKLVGAGAAPLESLYLPNVANDTQDNSWNNFLSYDWNGKTINYGKSMPRIKNITGKIGEETNNNIYLYSSIFMQL